MFVADTSWEKTRSGLKVTTPNRFKFILVGVVLFGAIGFLVVTGTANGGRFFYTINELLARPELAGKSVKVSGAVVGTSIKFYADTKTIHFTLANVTDDTTALDKDGGLAKALHDAVIDPNGQRINVVVYNQPVPDLLRDEAQAIVTGTLGSDGVFTADELLLKCPSKYAADVPQQVDPAQSSSTQ